MGLQVMHLIGNDPSVKISRKGKTVRMGMKHAVGVVGEDIYLIACFFKL